MSREWRAGLCLSLEAEVILSRWSGFTLSLGLLDAGDTGEAEVEAARPGWACLYTCLLCWEKHWSLQNTDSPLSGLEMWTLESLSQAPLHHPHLANRCVNNMTTSMISHLLGLCLSNCACFKIFSMIADLFNDRSLTPSSFS